MNESTRKIITPTLFFVILIAVVCIFWKGSRWAAGFFAGSVWSMLNFSFTLELLDIAVLRKSGRNVTAALLIKFPVLYLAGFAVLVWRIFPVMSIMTGLVASAAIMGLLKLWPKKS